MYEQILRNLGIEDTNPGGFAGTWVGSGPALDVLTPVDGSRLATVQQVTAEEYDAIVDRAHEAFLKWRTMPAPRRGEIVRQLGNKLREKKDDLGALVSLEMGKILVEGRVSPGSSTASPCSPSAPTTTCGSSGTRWAWSG